MKKLFSILILLAGLLNLKSQTNVIEVPVANYGLVAQPNVTVTWTLISPNPRLSGNILIRQDPISAKSDASGNAWFTNILWGQYSVTASGAAGTVIRVTVQTNSIGNVPFASIANFTANPPNPATNYYTMAQSDARFAPANSAVGTVTNIYGTNGAVVTVTNQSIIISADAAGAAKAATNGLASGAFAPAVTTNGFVTASITNGLATTNYVQSYADTNGAASFYAKNTTNGFTTLVYTNPSVVLYTNALPALTNGFVTASITNGLATTNYVQSYADTNGAAVFYSKNSTNGFTALVYTNPTAVLYTNSLPALTNGFVTASVTNGLATTNFVNTSIANKTNFPSIYVTNNAIVNGNLGIGTTSPNYTLDVNGDIFIGGKLLLNTISPLAYVDMEIPTTDSTLMSIGYEGAYYSAFSIYSPNKDWGFGFGEVYYYLPDSNHYLHVTATQPSEWYSSDPIQFQAGDYISLEANGGNVGIGTTSPNYTLDVNGNIGDSYNSGFFLITQDGTSSYLNGSGGNVGIGTTSPSHTLDVNGDIGASSAVIANTLQVNGYVQGPLYVTNGAFDISTNTANPSANQLVTANYVASILKSGQILYGSLNTTNVGITNRVGTTTNTVALLFGATAPTNYIKSFTNITAGQIFATIMTTNTYQSVSGPFVSTFYLNFTGNGPSPSIQIDPDIYITYDKTNLQQIAYGAAQTITPGTTNAYSWISGGQQYNSTNAAGFYLVRRVACDAVTSSGTYVLNVFGGTNYPTSLTFNTPVTVNANYSGTFTGTFTGNGSGLTNIPASNISQAGSSILWAGNDLLLNNGSYNGNQPSIQPTGDQGDGWVRGLLLSTNHNASGTGYKDCYGKVTGTNVVFKALIYTTNACGGSFCPRLYFVFSNTNQVARCTSGNPTYFSIPAGSGGVFTTITFTNQINFYNSSDHNSYSPAASLSAGYSYTNAALISLSSYYDILMTNGGYCWVMSTSVSFQ